MKLVVRQFGQPFIVMDDDSVRWRCNVRGQSGWQMFIAWYRYGYLVPYAYDRMLNSMYSCTLERAMLYIINSVYILYSVYIWPIL
eukprot:SAG31_NODE_2468_length_5651_cov_29.670929_2_plen_85_part_00